MELEGDSVLDGYKYSSLLFGVAGVEDVWVRFMLADWGSILSKSAFPERTMCRFCVSKKSTIEKPVWLDGLGPSH